MAVATAATGPSPADRLALAAWAALLAWGCSRSRRWAWLLVSGVAAAIAAAAWLPVAGAAALTAVAASVLHRRSRAIGSLVGAASALAVQHGTAVGTVPRAGIAVGLAAAVAASAWSTAPQRTRLVLRRGAAAGAVAATAALLGYGFALAEARLAADRGIVRLRAGLSAAAAGDGAAAGRLLAEASDLLNDAREDLRAPWARPASFVPGIGANARTIDTLATVAVDLAGRGATAARATSVDGVRLRQGRVDLARVDAAGLALSSVRDALADAEARLDHTASPWLLPPLADRLAVAVDLVADARAAADVAADAVAVLPGLLGGDGPRRYFVAFVTPVEARGRTGFIGNFAELEADGGRVTMTRFGRAQDLQTAGVPAADRALAGVDEYLSRYGRFRPAATWQNVTMSPDLPTVAEVVRQLYPQSGGRPVDGVVVVDPAGLAALLTFTGPVRVEGLDQPLTSANATAFLLEHQYVEVASTAARIDILEQTARATFERLTAGDLPPPAQLLEVLGPAVRGGHLQFVPFDAHAGALARRVSLDGAMPPVDGDFLAVTTNNGGGNKIDLYLKRSIDYQVEWDPATGSVRAVLSVTLRNDAPGHGLPEYVIGNGVGAVAPDGRDLPLGTNRMFVSVYTPWALHGPTLDGRPIAMEVQPELGRQAVSMFVDVGPGQVRTIRLHLSGTVGASDRYTLDVAGQPLARPEGATVTVDVVGGAEVGSGAAWTAADGGGARATFTVDGHRRLVVRSG